MGNRVGERGRGALLTNRRGPLQERGPWERKKNRIPFRSMEEEGKDEKKRHARQDGKKKKEIKEKGRETTSFSSRKRGVLRKNKRTFVTRRFTGRGKR